MFRRRKDPERGPTGDHGQHGDVGDKGQRGERGLTGKTGKSLTRAQTLIILGIFVGSGVLGLWRVQVQQDQIRAQQTVIQANTDNIIKTRTDNCYAGIAYIQRLNEQYDALIAIETSLRDDPDATELGVRVAKARINAYRNFKTPIPANACPPR